MAIKVTVVIDKLKSLNADLDNLQESLSFLQANLTDKKLKVDAPSGATYSLAKAISQKLSALVSGLDKDIVDALQADDSWSEEID